VLTLKWLDPLSLQQVTNGTSNVVSVEAEIRFNNQPVLNTKWLIVND